MSILTAIHFGRENYSTYSRVDLKKHIGKNDRSPALCNPPVLPLLSSELEASGRDTSKRKKRLLPLRRRKSDVAGGMSTQPVRARTASNGSSSSSSESVRGRRSSFAAVLQSRKARSARTSTASTECVPVSSSPSFRLGVEVVAVADPGVDQGQLKVRTGL